MVNKFNQFGSRKLDHFNRLNFTELKHLSFRSLSKTIPSFKMKIFVTLANAFQPLTNVTKNFILDALVGFRSEVIGLKLVVKRNFKVKQILSYFHI